MAIPVRTPHDDDEYLCLIIVFLDKYFYVISQETIQCSDEKTYTETCMICSFGHTKRYVTVLCDEMSIFIKVCSEPQLRRYFGNPCRFFLHNIIDGSSQYRMWPLLSPLLRHRILFGRIPFEASPFGMAPVIPLSRSYKKVVPLFKKLKTFLNFDRVSHNTRATSNHNFEQEQLRSPAHFPLPSISLRLLWEHEPQVRDIVLKLFSDFHGFDFCLAPIETRKLRFLIIPSENTERQTNLCYLPTACMVKNTDWGLENVARRRGQHLRIAILGNFQSKIQHSKNCGSQEPITKYLCAGNHEEKMRNAFYYPYHGCG